MFGNLIPKIMARFLVSCRISLEMFGEYPILFIFMDQNFISCDNSMTQGCQMVTRKLVELGALDMEMKGIN